MLEIGVARAAGVDAVRFALLSAHDAALAVAQEFQPWLAVNLVFFAPGKGKADALDRNGAGQVMW